MSDELARKIERLEDENLKLRKAIEELSILNEIATAIGSTLSMNKIMDLIVNKCIKHLNVEQCALMLFDQNKDDTYTTLIRRGESSLEKDFNYALTSELVGWMLKHRKPLVINALEKDERFISLRMENYKLRNLLSAPLSFQGQLVGLIYVLNKKGEMIFTSGDERLLSIIAGQSAQAIENSRLLEEEQSYICIQEEIRMAKEIQLNLLPKQIPDVPGYDIAALNIPESEVGGDYYDFINISKSRMAFCLGDVSGKGLPAALLMANLQATLRGQSFLQSFPKDIIKMSNSLLYNSTDIRKFATLFYGILDSENNEITFCNAGHENPLHLKSGNVFEELVTGGTVLGFLVDLNFSDEKIKFGEGEILTLFSDGIIDAMNNDAELFGTERLRNIILRNRSKNSAEIIKEIIAGVNKHVGENPQFDDITLLVIKRNNK